MLFKKMMIMGLFLILIGTIFYFDNEHSEDDYNTIDHIDSITLMNGKTGLKTDLIINSDTDYLVELLKQLKFEEYDRAKESDGFTWSIDINDGEIQLTSLKNILIKNKSYQIINSKIYYEITDHMDSTY